ncbi:unnamed protein product [Paramecium sonneborni]|uniref:Uncharacterized protein n=1 Tax=Paramecium sonneborni TaxID=65129 RepID=A0A8S1PAP3_9CILI|nr:unnamed protein product [Paramecium sonneborni]
MIELYCQQENHENETIIGVCTNEICRNKRLCCLDCVKEFHSTHNNDIQGLRSLKNQLTICEVQIEKMIESIGVIIQFLNQLKELEQIIQNSKEYLSKIKRQEFQNLGNKDYDRFINELLIIKQIDEAFLKIKDISNEEFSQKFKEIKTKIESFYEYQDSQISNNSNIKIQNELPQQLDRQLKLNHSASLFLSNNNELPEQRSPINSQISLESPRSLIIIQKKRSEMLPNYNILDQQSSNQVEWNNQSPLKEKIFQFIKSKFISPQQSGNYFNAQKYNCSIPDGFTNYKIGYFHLITKKEYVNDERITYEEANQQLLLDLTYFQNIVENYLQHLKINLNNYPENMKMLIVLVVFIEKNEKSISEIFINKDYQELYKKINGLKLCSNKAKHICEKKTYLKEICSFFKTLYRCSNGQPRK